MNIFDAAKDKIGEALRDNPDKAEQLSDQVLDRGEQLAEQRTGGQHADAIDKARQAVDERIATSGDPTQGGIIEQEGPTGTDPDATDVPPSGY